MTVAMNNGRYGSRRVRFAIQAPLTPIETRMKGPAQHKPAPMEANKPVMTGIWDVIFFKVSIPG
ncbi:hypothetical protein GCM10022277_29170 [Litoribacillus peritrichatus]|uniref:Uncharacterized protein n=1 Tax=Litoribacillus peritrichatus TaxID=718191 RepID=A0ABP7MVD7_9GAMM